MSWCCCSCRARSRGSCGTGRTSAAPGQAGAGAAPEPPPAPKPVAKTEQANAELPAQADTEAEVGPTNKPPSKDPEPLSKAAGARGAPAGRRTSRPVRWPRAARRKAAGVGLLAMADRTGRDSAAHRSRCSSRPEHQGKGLAWVHRQGCGRRRGHRGRSPRRATLITSNAGQRLVAASNTAAYSRDTGGGGLAGRATTLVEGVAGGGGGGGAGGGGSGRQGRNGQRGRGRRQWCRWRYADQEPAPARPRARSRTMQAWSSSATRARSTPSTTARCATIRRCRARWC